MKKKLAEGYALIAGKVGVDGVVALAEPGAPRQWVHHPSLNAAFFHPVEFLKALISARLSHQEKKQRWTDESTLFAVTPSTPGCAGEIIPFPEFRRMLGL